MTEPRTRVLHVAPTPFFSDRGCHIRIRGIVEGLDERGYESLVCTYSLGRDVDGVKTVRCRPIPGYTKTEAGPSGFKYFADVFLLVTVVRQVRRFQPDYLHCHLHEGVLIGWLARYLTWRRKLPLIFDMQGSLVGELTGHGYLRGKRVVTGLFRWLEARITSMADVCVCSSEASASLLTDEFGVDPKLVFLARDGADVSRQAGESRGRAEAATDDLPTVVYSGGLTKSKGLGVIQEVLREARQRQLPARFLIIGYPTAPLEAFVAEHGLESICQLTGQVPFDQLASYLGTASIALEPKSGGSGEASGKLVNYMAAGLPVVCFNTPNNRDILDGQGFFAPDGDIGAFVDQLEYALNNRVEADRFGQAGIARVKTHFSWTATADVVVSAYAGIRR